MTIQILLGEEIRSEVLKILSGQYMFQRHGENPRLFILSPWISDVDIEFGDLYISKEKSRQEEGVVIGGTYLFETYNIKSVNLPYALLLLKLLGKFEEGKPCEVNIVTLPPNEIHYSSDYLPKVKNLLAFLDEIGCNILVNPKLHSKLLLANDLALLGSFNLSSSALYYKEEIGISIDDLGNLNTLENYCLSVIHKSKLYGYSSPLKWGTFRDVDEAIRYEHGTKEYDAGIELAREKERLRKNRITRGWFLDQIILDVVNIGYGGEFHEFSCEFGGYDKFIKSYAHDLDLFYLLNIRNVISSVKPWVKGKAWVKSFFDYKGDESTDSIVEFVNTKFARKTVPDIRPRLKSLD